MTLTLLLGDCRERLAEMAPCSVDAIVTDPPYGIHFMAKSWDKFGGPLGHDHQLGHERSGSMHAGEYDYSKNAAFQRWTEEWAAGALRVLKPGGHMLVCGSPRTYHRMACGIEDAGFEIRDCLQWLFGSGFPKSLDVSKALDKAAGAEREVVGPSSRHAGVTSAEAPISDYARFKTAGDLLTTPATDLARQWEGWGTALKPAYEPIVLARKPLTGTVAANVTEWGTGALNIDGCRIEGAKGDGHWSGDDGSDATSRPGYDGGFTRGGRKREGRWPANVLLDEEAETDRISHGIDDRGGGSRFFYTAKTSRAEREFGLDDLDPSGARRNDHPTVKPRDLMRWLVRLVTPPGGLVCDPFVGSGSTGAAALDEGFSFVGIDLEERYLEIARRRIARRHMLEAMPPPADSLQGRLI